MDERQKASEGHAARESTPVSLDVWNEQEFSRHVELGRAVLEQYFKVVDELHRKEREVGILRSELDFMIDFIGRMLGEEDNGTLRVLLGRLRTTMNTLRSDQAH